MKNGFNIKKIGIYGLISFYILSMILGTYYKLK